MNSSTEPKPEPSACAYTAQLDILRGLPLFAGVPLEVSKVLAYLSVTETFASGDLLVREGEHSEFFRFVTCGRVRVTRLAGEREVLVKDMGPGDSFGGLSLIVDAKSLFTVRSLEETTTLSLQREKFLKTVQRFPQIQPAVLEALAGHVLSWEERFLARHPEEFASLGQDFGLTLF